MKPPVFVVDAFTVKTFYDELDENLYQKIHRKWTSLKTTLRKILALKKMVYAGKWTPSLWSRYTGFCRYSNAAHQSQRYLEKVISGKPEGEPVESAAS
ncbi:hypothetical protein HPG69_009845 [Diceros bicornis minor]|uniref:Uncharacterized protein n=1 Tax=Diceros bicornis minor TaxID=77932 RepID=A0A7J7EWE7_DICBM|nr:hypothetical protein HPG69_009845 [Diceros bicornis minor]